jgi:hypothetical protein
MKPRLVRVSVSLLTMCRGGSAELVVDEVAHAGEALDQARRLGRVPRLEEM